MRHDWRDRILETEFLAFHVRESARESTEVYVYLWQTTVTAFGPEASIAPMNYHAPFQGQRTAPAGARRAFTLVELSVAVIIIGVLAAFGIPRLIRSVEKSRASEAFKYLTSVRDAQERHSMRNGEYAASIEQLDFRQADPAYFVLLPIVPGGTGSLEDSWSMTLRRQGAAAGYGAYEVTFTEKGYHPAASTIEALPDIHPMAR